MKYGFIIRRLSVLGPDVPRAEVCFERGLNTVIGPSDTGKTFIGQCIDFALGGGTRPKKIPEAKKYDSVELEIESADGSEGYTLRRGLEGGAIQCLSQNAEPIILGERHKSGRTASASGFLLHLSGLAGKRIRTNQRGATSDLSFRDLAKLVLVNEVQIQSPRSPIYSGDRSDSPREARVFRVLLTGNDDSAVIAKADPKVVKGQRDGKAEVITELITRVQSQLKELDVVDPIKDIREQVGRLQATVDLIATEVAAEQSGVGELEEARKDIWRRLRGNESRENVLSELRTRFVLLREQYSSDLRRLDAIAETGGRLSQMNEERCAVCGALREHASAEHQHDRFDATDVTAACRAEAEKIGSLLRDLGTTLTQTTEEITELQRDRLRLQEQLDAAAREVRASVQPRLQAALARLKEAQALRDARTVALHLLERIEELEEMQKEVARRPKSAPAEPSAPAVSVGDAEGLMTHVAALLKAWHFPNLRNVAFSDSDQDIVVSGRDRNTHGKGVLALTHAAFNFGLLRLCLDENKPFPGFVLTDSPLVVYQEPDPGEEGFPLDVKDAFYRSLASDFGDSQVIVFENDGPPTDVVSKANIIVFTASSIGRRGFIPT